MRRKTFDLILTSGGALVVVVLLAAGALAMWGYSYSNTSVRNQLAAQQIFFPAKAAFAHPKAGTEITPAMTKTVEPYAGQQVLNGQQAAVYANDFIAVHLSEMPYHGVYSLVSGAARAAKPGSTQATTLAAVETTVFQGTTLRGLLLEANGFWTFGQIALWAGIIAFIFAGVMALMTGLGVWHLRKVSAAEEVFPRLYKEASKAA
ncbi:MAG: hypothetical protein WCF24_06240 [Acidimicrobiales bacterium]